MAELRGKPPCKRLQEEISILIVRSVKHEASWICGRQKSNKHFQRQSFLAIEMRNFG